MIRKNLLFCIIACILNAAQAMPTLAVFDFEGHQVAKSDIIGLSNRLRLELIKIGRYNVIEYTRMQEVLGTSNLQQRFTANMDTVLKGAQALDASKVVTGRIDKVGSTYSIAVKKVDVQTGEVDTLFFHDCTNCSVDNVLSESMPSIALILSSLEYTETIISLPQEKVKKEQFARDGIVIIPLLGYSYTSGIIGCEIQYNQLGFQVGFAGHTEEDSESGEDEDIFSMGIKHYLSKANKSSFYVGFCFGQKTSDSFFVYDKDFDLDYYLGVLIGGQKRLQNKPWVFNFGIGAGMFFGDQWEWTQTYNYYENGHWDIEEEVSKFKVMFDFSVGYSF